MSVDCLGQILSSEKVTSVVSSTFTISFGLGLIKLDNSVARPVTHCSASIGDAVAAG